MFAKPPFFIRMLRRPCSDREDCFKEWSWTDAGPDGVCVTCKTCGSQFTSKESGARLVFVENDKNDVVQLRKELDKFQGLAEENKELREKVEKLEGSGGRTGYMKLIEPLE